MMDLVCPSYGLEIFIIGVSEELKTLMNKYVMHQKIGETVKGYAQTNPEQKIKTLLHSEKQSSNARESKNQKEKVVVLEKSRCLFFMVVLV